MFANKRILTVDDSATIRVFLATLLKAQGAEVDEASTGQQALTLDSRKYDLILLDLMLPDMDGIQVLASMRAQNDKSTIVMLTGVGGIKSAITAVQQGADGYIEKQDLSVNGDRTEFFYALQQAFERREGIQAQKQLQEVRADFYSMVTHDLRNPTGVILLSLSMLLEEEAGPLSSQQKEFLVMARDSANKLLGLINDYLDFAKINAGYLRLDVREAELRSVVEASARLANLQARSRQQQLVLDLPPAPVYAQVDAERLKQVLDNLISNAIKYTPKGGSITISLSAANDQVTLQVSDTGCGIPPSQQAALFAKYYRVPGQTTRSVNGTGLGLLIVREIVRAHGGTVSVESQGLPGKGSTFTVRIPWRRESTSAAVQ